MRKVFWGLFAGIMLVAGLARAETQNGERGNGKSELGQNSKVNQLLLRIQALEERLSKSEKPSETKTASWVKRVKVNGDLRYRHELIRVEGKDDRNRQRIRARIGLKAKVSDGVDIGFLLASGSSDPVSSNQTLDGGFSSKSIWFDLAYFDYHPENLDGLHVIGWKMKNPFHRPGKTELVWDGDLRLEGGAVKYSKTFDKWNLFTNWGGFWAEERSAGADSGLFGMQAGVKHKGDRRYFLAGGSYYDYGNVKGLSPLFDPTDAFGNTVDAGGNYQFDYNLMEFFAEFGFKAGEIPISLFGNYVKNTASGVKENQGWLVGLNIGKCKVPHSWAFRYNYRDIEMDSVLGAFTDSDFIGGGTDGRGHEVGLDFQLDKVSKISVSFFQNERALSSAAEDFQRLQIDLAFKF